MECHPQYGEDDCNQYVRDVEIGRDPKKNPYRGESWYSNTLCDLVCAAIYSIDQKTCTCVDPSSANAVIMESSSDRNSDNNVPIEDRGNDNDGSTALTFTLSFFCLIAMVNFIF